MARRLPKPFQRPSVTVASGGRRSWQTVPPYCLGRGDTVADRGRVEDVEGEFFTPRTSMHAEVIVDTRVLFLSGKIETARGVLRQDLAQDPIWIYEGGKVFAFTEGIPPRPLRG